MLILVAAIAAAFTAPSAAVAATGALQHEDECATLAFIGSDDGSSGQLNLGFTVRFGWQDFDSIYVNNNGNLTFGGPLPTFSPYVPSYLGHRMIAPFFADVDTRAGHGSVTWGAGTLGDGSKFFCATWREVGYYNAEGDKRNTFQAILTQSPDQAPSKAMTITFNYEKIEWETGAASQGEGGFGGMSALVSWFDGIEIGATAAGSLIPGSLLDSNSETGLIHQVHEGQAGRIQYDYSYVESYPADGVLLDFSTAETNLPVEVCALDGNTCFWKYSYASLPRFRAVVPPGTYRIAAFARAATARTMRTLETPPLLSNQVWSSSLPLGPALTPPSGEIAIEGSRHTPAGIPVLTTAESISISLPTCPGESEATVQIATNTGTVVQSKPMSPDPARGTVATLPPGSVGAGEYAVTIERECAGTGPETLTFGLYVTPAVRVVNQYEEPIADAEVTLLRADDEGELLNVLDPDTDFLTPASRVNPMSTSPAGLAGWSMRMGSYQVEAKAADCFNPVDHGRLEARSERFEVDLNHPAPDPVTVALLCPNAQPPVGPKDPEPGIEKPKPAFGAPGVSFRLRSRCVGPHTGSQRRGFRARPPLRASIRVSRRARVNLLIERREIAPRRFRCRIANRAPLRRSSFRRVGRITRTLAPGRYQLRMPVAAPRARSSAAKVLRLPLQRLRPGTYRITATATDRHGTSKPVRTQFLVLAPRR